MCEEFTVQKGVVTYEGNVFQYLAHTISTVKLDRRIKAFSSVTVNTNETSRGENNEDRDGG